MSKPLFILGKHRSGTTFLSNLLLGHPAIAAVYLQEAHGGITGGVFESAFFSCIDGRYGDITRFEHYMEFASVASSMEYFRLAGVSKEVLLSLFPADYATVFRTVMESIAAEKKADYWLEKTPAHTLKAFTIKRYYPDARFIGITRDEVDSAVSSLYLKKKQDRGRLVRLGSLAKVTCLKYLYDASLRKLKKRYPDDVLLVEYESLTTQTVLQTVEICGFLEIEKMTLESSYPPNTSFRGNVEKKLYAYEKATIRCLYRGFLRLVPFVVLKSVYVLYCRFVPDTLPVWLFRTYQINLSRSQNQYVAKYLR